MLHVCRFTMYEILPWYTRTRLPTSNCCLPSGWNGPASLATSSALKRRVDHLLCVHIAQHMCTQICGHISGTGRTKPRACYGIGQSPAMRHVCRKSAPHSELHPDCDTPRARVYTGAAGSSVPYVDDLPPPNGPLIAACQTPPNTNPSPCHTQCPKASTILAGQQ
jgi:hypothetical protein